MSGMFFLTGKTHMYIVASRVNTPAELKLLQISCPLRATLTQPLHSMDVVPDVLSY